MTNEQAARILDPETSREALWECEYYGGFRGAEARLEACNEACRVAAKVLREQETTCHQLTNADRLRGMSDEELARQFGAQCPKESKRPCDKQCNLCWLEWLQQPAKEGD